MHRPCAEPKATHLVRCTLLLPYNPFPFPLSHQPPTLHTILKRRLFGFTGAITSNMAAADPDPMALFEERRFNCTTDHFGYTE